MQVAICVATIATHYWTLQHVIILVAYTCHCSDFPGYPGRLCLYVGHCAVGGSKLRHFVDAKVLKIRLHVTGRI